MTYIITVLC